jgi:DNA polymerase II large subunit
VGVRAAMGGVLEPARQAAASPTQEAYFQTLQREAERALAVARAARRQGWDPTLDVEIVLAEDLAARVEAQIELPGAARLVRDLTARLKDRELVALEAARAIARGELRAFPKPEQAVDKAVRAGLSILTEGILVAPLEGIAKVQIGRNDDGTDYVDLYFAGPIRAAGGTAQAMSVLLADVVRRDLGIGRFQPTTREIERYKEEVPAYKQAQHLQYVPPAADIEQIVRHCPVCINGEGTEREEVTGHRDLPRVETNQLRGGAVLVLAEGLTQKAAKVMKHVAKLGLADWNFLESFAKKKTAAADESFHEIEASDKFILELIAGRPVFAHPSRPGGFRLRYGRGRTCGIASTAISPVTMYAVDEFLAVGTQLKLERPGKGTICTPCAGLEGPTVVLDNGDMVRVDAVEAFKALKPRVRRITDLGEILIPFGEFVENNAVLPDASFTVEWWGEILRAKAGDAVADHLLSRADPTFDEALAWSRQYGVPLHPHHTLLWHDVPLDQLRAFAARVAPVAHWSKDGLEWPRNDADKEILVALNCTHREREGRLLVDRLGPTLAASLGFALDGERVLARDVAHATDPALARFPSVEWVAANLGVAVKPRAPTRVGARMGRPEKADLRKMDPPVHGIYPLGEAGGLQRDVAKTAEKRTALVEVARRRCPECERETHASRCACGGHTEDVGAPPSERPVPVGLEFEAALRRLRLGRTPTKIKGVAGLMSKSKTPEALDKAILRAHHDVYVFKDGTIRYDLTDAPLTHFRPAEIGTPVAKLVDLGYTHDTNGRPLVSPDQVLELRVQDVIPARTCGDYLVHVANLVDDLLVKLYGLDPYYGVSRAPELVGHLVAGLAPHTSGAVLGRIIGFTASQVCWAHPFFHTSKRRNCDGDEDALLLLLDAFLNFSKVLIPDRRGGLMDLPLVLSLRIDPREIDKEAHNLDTLWRYPLALYEAAEQHRPAKELAKQMGLVESRLGTPSMYEGFGYTLDTPSIQEAPRESSYKTLGAMEEKMERQLQLAERIRAVDAGDVAGRVLSTHLLPDILGNLKAFAKQKVRCTKCNAKYRRVPLGGLCTHVGSNGKSCANPLTLTVPQAGVRKYLELAIRIAARYPVPEYTRERVKLAQRFVDESFAPERYRVPSLSDFT